MDFNVFVVFFDDLAMLFMIFPSHMTGNETSDELLDKRLDRLVAKTERCSKMLAKRVNTFMHQQQPAPSGGLRSESGAAYSQPRSQRRVTFEDDRMSDANEATSRKLDQLFTDEARDGDYQEGDEDEADDETTLIE